MSIRGKYVDNLLFDAMLSLAEEMPLNKITVSKLVERAGVSRQTFYNHYKDINDLISLAPFEFVKSRSMTSFDSAAIREAYEFALEHKGFFSQLPSHMGQNNFRESFVFFVGEFNSEGHIDDDMDEDEKLTRALAINMLANGVVGLFLDWCESGLSWPIDKLIEAQEMLLPDFMRQ